MARRDIKPSAGSIFIGGPLERRVECKENVRCRARGNIARDHVAKE
jgi:hypothetical protein